VCPGHAALQEAALTVNCHTIKGLQSLRSCVILLSAFENPVRPLEPQRNNLAKPQSNPQGIPTLEKRKNFNERNRNGEVV
jgi:hypothetical protein